MVEEGIYYNSNTNTFVGIHTDDLITAGPIEELMKHLEAKFEVKPLGEPKRLLGMNMNIKQGIIEIDQSDKIQELIDQYGINNRTCNTPIPTHLKLKRPKDNTMKNKNYPKMVGKIRNIADVSRPDLAYPASQLGRYLQNNGEQHMAAARQVIQYLSKTKHLKLQYYAKPQTAKTKKITITCFADSSYADLQDRRSAMGFIVVVEGNIVHWGSNVHNMDVFVLEKNCKINI
eukprot:Pgem_evm1s561